MQQSTSKAQIDAKSPMSKAQSPPKTHLEPCLEHHHQSKPKQNPTMPEAIQKYSWRYQQ